VTKNWWRVRDSNPRSITRLIYSERPTVTASHRPSSRARLCWVAGSLLGSRSLPFAAYRQQFAHTSVHTDLALRRFCAQPAVSLVYTFGIDVLTDRSYALAMIEPMPSNLRSFRVDDDLWASAQEVAREREESLSSDVLRPALQRYVDRHGAVTPRAWIAAFSWDGMPRTGSGPVAVVTEDADGRLPDQLVNPADQNGAVLEGTWLFDGRDEKARIVSYHRVGQGHSDD